MEEDNDQEVTYYTGMELEALVAHEMYQLYRKAGFTENQALKLVAFNTVANFDEIEEEEEESE